jgi:hypothetical protein
MAMASSCCLLHWFLCTAARLPNHLAIIHAFFSPRESSVSHVHDQQLQRECEEHVQAITTATDQLGKNDGGVVPVFPRDVVYSYDELRVAVESLGCLLVRALGLPTPGSSQEEKEEEEEGETEKQYFLNLFVNFVLWVRDLVIFCSDIFHAECISR